MAKKQIQVSTVKMESDVQVIFINASLITKVVRAQIMMHNAFDKAIEHVMQQKYSDDGKPIEDENGDRVQEEVTYFDANRIDADAAQDAYDATTALLDELNKAFEEA